MIKVKRFKHAFDQCDQINTWMKESGININDIISICNTENGVEIWYKG